MSANGRAPKLLTTLPTRLHHFAYTTDDPEATRRFYEDIIGLPLLATCIERQYSVGEWVEVCQSFYGLGDGSALVFLSFSDPEKQEAWRASQQSVFVRISLAVEQSTKDEIAARLKVAGRGIFSVDHGDQNWLYVRDPNGLLLEFTVDPPYVCEIKERMAETAHDDLERWIARRWPSENRVRDSVEAEASA